MTEEEREAQRQLDRLNREMWLDLQVAVKDAEEHDHPGPQSQLPQLAQEADAVRPRQDQVDHRQVRLPSPCSFPATGCWGPTAASPATPGDWSERPGS